MKLGWNNWTLKGHSSHKIKKRLFIISKKKKIHRSSFLKETIVHRSSFLKETIVHHFCINIFKKQQQPHQTELKLLNWREKKKKVFGKQRFFWPLYCGGGGGGDHGESMACRLKPWIEDIPLVEFMYLVFTRMPGESYHRQLWSLLLYLCYAFHMQINSLVGWSCSGECTAGTHEAETEVISWSFIQDHQVKQRKERRSGREGKGEPYQFHKGLKPKWYNKDPTVSLKVYWWTDTEEKMVTPLHAFLNWHQHSWKREKDSSWPFKNIQ